MTRTIVTGASGFIGSRLVEKIGSCWKAKHDEIVHGHSYNSDRTFFLSTYGNMAHHTDTQMMVKANVQDLLTMLNGFNGWFCYMSSSSVMLPVQTPYSRSKRAGEEILQALPELKSCIVRPYSVTGVGEQKEHLIPTLIRSCMEGEEMPFVPWPQHDFIDVEDVVRGLIWLYDNQKTGMIELGSGIPHSNQEVLKMVQHSCGKKANIRSQKSIRTYDNTEWYCKTERPYWVTKKSLSESISEMVEAYKHEHS